MSPTLRTFARNSQVDHLSPAESLLCEEDGSRVCPWDGKSTPPPHRDLWEVPPSPSPTQMKHWNTAFHSSPSKGKPGSWCALCEDLELLASAVFVPSTVVPMHCLVQSLRHPVGLAEHVLHHSEPEAPRGKVTIPRSSQATEMRPELKCTPWLTGSEHLKDRCPFNPLPTPLLFPGPLHSAGRGKNRRQSIF